MGREGRKDKEEDKDKEKEKDSGYSGYQRD